MKFEDAEILFKMADRIGIKTFGTLQRIKTACGCESNRDLMKAVASAYCHTI